MMGFVITNRFDFDILRVISYIFIQVSTFFGLIPILESTFSGLIPILESTFSGLIPILESTFSGLIPILESTTKMVSFWLCIKRHNVRPI